MISLNAKVVNVVYGKNFKLVNPCNLYGCTFGDDVFIGPFVEVQKGVNVGSRTKIQSHTFVCELVEIGSDCFIGHGVVFINDTFSTGRPSWGIHRSGGGHGAATSRLAQMQQFCLYKSVTVLLSVLDL